MTKFSVLALALGAAVAAVAPRSDSTVIALADDGSINAAGVKLTGAVALYNGCKRNV